MEKLTCGRFFIYDNFCGRLVCFAVLEPFLFKCTVYFEAASFAVRELVKIAKSLVRSLGLTCNKIIIQSSI